MQGQYKLDWTLIDSPFEALNDDLFDEHLAGSAKLDGTCYNNIKWARWRYLGYLDEATMRATATRQRALGLGKAIRAKQSDHS